MKKAITIILAVTVIAGVYSLSSCENGAADVKAAPRMATKADTIKRGEYLVGIMGCNDCHSSKSFGPKGPVIDSMTKLGGFLSSKPIPKVSKSTGQWVLFAPDLTAAVGPWGMSFAANISSDATGVGNWSEEQFVRVMREGKYMGLREERNILPPMPWQSYGALADADLHAIFTYLKSTKPVKNVVPAPIAPDKIPAE
ncbi:MAG: diheme cytochrome c-553 [Mucilaginibacter sp.]